MHELYELKEMLCKELEEYGRKGDLSAGSLEIVDKLAHALKNVDKIIESKEEESGEYSGAMPRRGGSYRYDDGMMTCGYYRGGSYARGRGSNARRDSMGRYSSRDYSRAEGDMAEIVEELRGMMDSLPEEKRHEVERFVEKVERM
jgi:hypothetical protein